MAQARGATEPAQSPETVDRLMVGVCGAIWLVLLAISVIATVALVQLGKGHQGGGEERSSWLLYSIIVVSALVIIGAIPLLLRARQAALTEPPPDVPVPDAPVRPTEAPTEKLRVFGTSVDPKPVSRKRRIRFRPCPPPPWSDCGCVVRYR